MTKMIKSVEKEDIKTVIITILHIPKTEDTLIMFETMKICNKLYEINTSLHEINSTLDTIKGKTN